MGTNTIENQALVIERLGYWPSFHDAEIDRVYLTRGQRGYWPIISLWINVRGRAEAAATGTETGQLWQLELLFEEVIDNELEGFNHQNVIFDFTFQQEEFITATIKTSYGMSGSITARRVAVKSLLAIDTRE
jgi:hypothetical protein